MKEEREGPEIEAEAVEEEPKIEVVEAPALEAEVESEAGAEGEAEPQEDLEAVVEDRLELDRMEVRQPPGKEEEPGETEEVILEMPRRKAPERRKSIFAVLVDHWIWVVACLVGLSVVSAALLFVLMPERGVSRQVKLGKRVHAVSASLGGEYYVRFNLWGPFRDAAGQALLRESMPKIRHALIVSGSRPEVARAIRENDLYYLEKLVLGIVSRETGIPIGRLDLKGLSVTRYSDETEVEGDR